MRYNFLWIYIYLYIYNVKSCVHASTDAISMYKCTDAHEREYARVKTRFILIRLTI